MEAPGAPAGRADATRRWALRLPDGRERFAGVTRGEGEEAASAMAEVADPERALVRVGLPALLSQGAGPHLIDAGGRLVLGLGAHGRIAGLRVAMGEAAPTHRVGVVRALGRGGLWAWVAAADVAAPDRVAALDALDAAADDAGLAAWEATWRGRGRPD